MTGVRKPTRILALPVLRKKWLYAVEETVEDLKQLPSWRTGRTLTEKARLGQAGLLQEVHRRILKQWEGLKQAPEGSIKHRLYRLAQGVLDQEDVSETFLKALSSATDRYDVLYPSDSPQRYVRRRLRLFLRQQEYFNRCRLISWSVAAVPMLPLMVLPFPNIPLYYAGYKAYSHNKALRGCRHLLDSVRSSSTSYTASSPALTAAPFSAEALAAVDPSVGNSTPHCAADSSHAAEGSTASTAGSAAKPAQPALIQLLPEDELARILQDNQRASEEPAVDEETAQIIGERFGFADLPKLLSRVLKGVRGKP